MQIVRQGAELDGQKKSALFHFLVLLQHFGNVWKDLLINHHLGTVASYPIAVSELEGIQHVHSGEHSRVREEGAMSVEENDSVARLYEILCRGGSSSAAAEVVEETNGTGFEGNLGSSGCDENHPAARCRVLLGKRRHLLLDLVNMGGDGKFFCQPSINGRYPGLSHDLMKRRRRNKYTSVITMVFKWGMVTLPLILAQCTRVTCYIVLQFGCVSNKTLVKLGTG